MSGYSTFEIWLIIIVMGIGTFFLRYSFLGMVGKHPLPAWALRYLRYTPVAVLPGLVAPMVIWPAASHGEADPSRILAASVTVLAGLVSRNVLVAILSGLAALYLGIFVLF